MGLNLIPYDYSVSVGVYQDDWLRLVSQDSYDLSLLWAAGLTMESWLCLQLQIDEEETQF